MAKKEMGQGEELWQSESGVTSDMVVVAVWQCCLKLLCRFNILN